MTNFPELPMRPNAYELMGSDGIVRLHETVPSYTNKMGSLARRIAMSVMRGEIERPTKLLCIPRGGLTPTEIVARALGLMAEDVISIGARTYDGEDKKGNLVIGQVPEPELVDGQVLLIAEDVADTGETLEVVRAIVEPLKPKALYTGAVYEKGKCKSPDFTIERTDRWIVLPYDGLEDFANYFNAQMSLPLEQRDVSNMQYDPTVGLHLPARGHHVPVGISER